MDDLLAIVIIAVFYPAGISGTALLAALAGVGALALRVRSRAPRWWFLITIAVVTWSFMHASGVHATIAGVLLGLCVPARPVRGEPRPRTESLGAAVRPYSAGIAFPAFAFFSAGVSLSDGGGPTAVLGQPVALAIVTALVLGKLVGVLGVTAVVTRLTPLRLPGPISLRDLVPVGFLAGIGFTVSLLIAELSFADSEHGAGAKAAVLTASTIAATLAALALRHDARRASLRGQDAPDATGPGAAVMARPDAVSAFPPAGLERGDGGEPREPG